MSVELILYEEGECTLPAAQQLDKLKSQAAGQEAPQVPSCKLCKNTKTQTIFQYPILQTMSQISKQRLQTAVRLYDSDAFRVRELGELDELDRFSSF